MRVALAPPRSLTVATAVAIIVLLVGCTEHPQTERWPVFGTTAELTLPADTPEPLRREASRVLAAQWQAHEADWHAWEPSALTAFNAALAQGAEAPVPPSLRALIERSRPLVEDSGGHFDPGVGRLVAAWGFHTGEFPIRTPPPDDATLDSWAARPDSLRDLHCDAEWRCVTTAPRLQLDFNAVAEGLALEEGAQALRALGVRGALLNLGGDVVALGANDGVPWRVGLDDGEGGVLGGVELRDGEAFMSSGRYVKFRESPDGERWPHVLDARTGRPATGARLSAVLYADAMRADAAATALLAAGPAGFERVARGMGLGCALLVDAEGRRWITKGMAARFTWQRALPEAARIDTGVDCGTR